jgi:hypothetical protein
LNPRPLGYEPNELPDCSTPRHVKRNRNTFEQGRATTRREARLVLRALQVLQNDQHLASADQTQLLPRQQLDRCRILPQTSRGFSQLRILQPQALHVARQLIRDVTCAGGRHEATLADERIDEQDNGREDEQIVQRPASDWKRARRRNDARTAKRFGRAGAVGARSGDLERGRHRFGSILCRMVFVPRTG